MSAPGIALAPRTAIGLRGLVTSDAAVRILAGVVILLFWEILVRLAAPNYVARPSRIVTVFPEVITSPLIRASHTCALAPGDDVTLLGCEGDARLDAQQIARVAGTISYNILCSISARVHRVYI